jgi:hypothetical protein
MSVAIMGPTIMGPTIMGLIDMRTETGSIAMGIAKHTGVTITTTTRTVIVKDTKTHHQIFAGSRKAREETHVSYSLDHIRARGGIYRQ